MPTNQWHQIHGIIINNTTIQPAFKSEELMQCAKLGMHAIIALRCIPFAHMFEDIENRIQKHIDADMATTVYYYTTL